MASADELIREAQYAFRNIGHGSTDEKKHRAQAEKYARRVIRKYPGSIEASQAERILEQINVRIDVRSEPNPSAQPDPAADFARDHSLSSGHTQQSNWHTNDANEDSNAGSFADADFEGARIDDDWKEILRRFAMLPRNKKNLLGLMAVFAVFFPGGILLVFGVILYYATHSATLKRHLLILLDRLEP